MKRASLLLSCLLAALVAPSCGTGVDLRRAPATQAITAARTPAALASAPSRAPTPTRTPGGLATPTQAPNSTLVPPAEEPPGVPVTSPSTPPLVCIGKVQTTPDYTQTDPAYGGLPHLSGRPPGDQYCAPVAVSNSLMWLDDHGFDGLVAPDTADRKQDQFRVILELGSPEYMSTNLESGTGANELLRGTAGYLRDREYGYVRLEYQGWRAHAAQFSTGVDVPDLDWIMRGVEGYGSVWLNVGWYTYEAESDTYTRTGGHWVTLVGYGYDGSRESPHYLVIHDPSPRAGSGFANEHVLLVRIETGTLDGNYRGLPHGAGGFYKLTGGMHVRSSADLAVLDGAVVLEMAAPVGR